MTTPYLDVGSPEFQVLHPAVTDDEWERLIATVQALNDTKAKLKVCVEALFELEDHHLKNNVLADRPKSHSRTLRIVREALWALDNISTSRYEWL
jgi:hypothetical protein